MSGGKETQSNASQNVATNAIDPDEKTMLLGNVGAAQARAGSLTPYTGPLTAGFTPAQTQAQTTLSSIATDPRYRAANSGAMGIVQGVADAAIPQYDAAQLAGTDLKPYENPFTQDVINSSLATLNQQRGQQGVADNAQATAAGAFGGSRQGVQRALTAGQYDLNSGNLIAGLNSANFNQAQQGALSDIASRNNASQFNANTQLTGQAQRLTAAGALSSLNNNDLALATQQGGILATVGDAQQQQQQTEITNALNAYYQGQQLTIQQQQLINQALGLVPNQQTITSTGSGTGTVTKSGDVLGGVLGAVAGGAKIGSSLYG